MNAIVPASAANASAANVFFPMGDLLLFGFPSAPCRSRTETTLNSHVRPFSMDSGAGFQHVRAIEPEIAREDNMRTVRIGAAAASFALLIVAGGWALADEPTAGAPPVNLGCQTSASTAVPQPSRQQLDA